MLPELCPVKNTYREASLENACLSRERDVFRHYLQNNMKPPKHYVISSPQAPTINEVKALPASGVGPVSVDPKRSVLCNRDNTQQLKCSPTNPVNAEEYEGWRLSQIQRHTSSMHD